jgi:hypothetical protein
MDTTTKLQDALAHLGDTLAMVIHALRSEGIKGKQHKCGECPVARYLLAKTGVPVKVGTNEVWHVQTGTKEASYRIGDIVSLPRYFVRLFDDGAYPDLIDSGWVAARSERSIGFLYARMGDASAPNAQDRRLLRRQTTASGSPRAGALPLLRR